MSRYQYCALCSPGDSRSSITIHGIPVVWIGRDFVRAAAGRGNDRRFHAGFGLARYGRRAIVHGAILEFRHQRGEFRTPGVPHLGGVPVRVGFRGFAGTGGSGSGIGRWLRFGFVWRAAELYDGDVPRRRLWRSSLGSGWLAAALRGAFATVVRQLGGGLDAPQHRTGRARGTATLHLAAGYDRELGRRRAERGRAAGRGRPDGLAGGIGPGGPPLGGVAPRTRPTLPTLPTCRNPVRPCCYSAAARCSVRSRCCAGQNLRVAPREVSSAILTSWLRVRTRVF